MYITANFIVDILNVFEADIYNNRMFVTPRRPALQENVDQQLVDAATIFRARHHISQDDTIDNATASVTVDDLIATTANVLPVPDDAFVDVADDDLAAVIATLNVVEEVNFCIVWY